MTTQRSLARTRLIALASILLTALCANGAPGTAAQPGSLMQDQDWYQIELVLFAQNIPPKRDELWPLRSHVYPRDTLGLDPRPGQITPPSLRLLPFLTGSANDLQVENDRPVFRFENRSRYRRQLGECDAVCWRLSEEVGQLLCPFLPPDHAPGTLSLIHI